VPASLRMLGLLYWSFCTVTGLGGMLASLSGPIRPELLALAMAFVFMLVILAAGWFILASALHWANRSRAGAVLAPLLAFFALGPPVGLLGGGLVGLLVVATSIALYWGMARVLSQDATVRIDQASLTVQIGKNTQQIPLEDIGAISRRVSWWSPEVRLGAVSVPALVGLTGAEWTWMSAQIRAQAARRQRQLAEAGHDLGAAASPPPALAALRERP